MTVNAAKLFIVVEAGETVWLCYAEPNARGAHTAVARFESMAAFTYVEGLLPRDGNIPRFKGAVRVYEHNKEHHATMPRRAEGTVFSHVSVASAR